MKPGGSQPLSEWSEMIIMLRRRRRRRRGPGGAHSSIYLQHCGGGGGLVMTVIIITLLSSHWQKVMNQTDPSWPEQLNQFTNWSAVSPSSEEGCCVPGVTSVIAKWRSAGVLWLVSCPLILCWEISTQKLIKCQWSRWVSPGSSYYPKL